MPRRVTTEEFIERAKAVHGGRYDYSSTVYVNANAKIKYVCPVHGEVEQWPKVHVRNSASRKSAGCPRCIRRQGGPVRQRSGETWEFPCVHGVVTLPARGVSNGQVRWSPSLERWYCRSCDALVHKKSRDGSGRQGLLSRMKHIVRSSKDNAKKSGYAPISESPEDLLRMWALQGGADAITEEPIDLLAAVAHHDHDCGKTFGFVSSWVNLAEGHLRKLSYEGRAKMFAKMFPEEVKRATELLSETTVKGENDKRRTTSSDCISE